MTRDELRENVRGSLFDEQYTDYVMANIDAYTTAIIAQSKCSTPLDVLEQMLIEKQKHQTENKGSGMRPIDYEVNVLHSAIKLIKERQPMA